ncbi:MAG: SdpI family protein [Bacteroidales bacterium]|nr:SdpI family protein [Bacteroidales bacterium]
MIIENPLFLIALIFIITGFILHKFPPKTINTFYGYRTKRSMRNQNSWNFAQLYSSKLMMQLGLLYALIGLIGFIYKPSETIIAITAIALLIIIAAIIIVKVEKKLKNKFN